MRIVHFTVQMFRASILLFVGLLFLLLSPLPARAAVGLDVSTSCTISANFIRVSAVLSNSSDTATLAIGVVDDAGTPGVSVDDFVLTGPGFLSPGAKASYGGAFQPGVCGQFTNTVTVTSTNVALIITQSVSVCGFDAALAVSKSCNVVSNGTLISFVGTVTNAGNVALNFVTATDDHGTPGNPNDDTIAFGPATLQPGAGAVFGANYITSSGLHTNTLTATGYYGPNLTNCFVQEQASAICDTTGVPLLSISEMCTSLSNGTFTLISGTISNLSAVTLATVIRADHGTPAQPNDDFFVGAAVILPGQGANYSKVFVPICGLFTNTVTVTVSNNPSIFAQASCASVGNPPGCTPTGTNVMVRPIDLGIASNVVSLVFSDVIESGDSTGTTTNAGPLPPSGFRLGFPVRYYDIGTTALFTGKVSVCVDYTGINYTNENALGLFHFVNNSWVEISSSLDTNANIICGETSSFSPFAVFEVAYVFAGFYSPVDNPPVINTAKAGSAIPVKFSLNGNYGLDIFATGYPKSDKINCQSNASEDALEETVTTGGSSLTYDATTQRYQYVWKTDKSWSGTCRRLIIRLNDGSEHTADFKFTK